MNRPDTPPGGAAAADLPDGFEAALAELETLVARLEDGRLPLEDALAGYRRGVALVGHCRTELGGVVRQIRVLEADLLRPFEGEETDDIRA